MFIPGNSPGNEVVAGVCQLEILGVLEKMQLTTSHVPRPNKPKKCKLHLFRI